MTTNTIPMTSETSKFEVKPYSKKELAAFYSVSPRIFTKWIKNFEEVGPKMGRYYTINQVRIIVEKLGIPETISS